MRGTEARCRATIPVLFIANRPEVHLGGQVNLMRLLERIDRQRTVVLDDAPRSRILLKRFARQTRNAQQERPLFRVDRPLIFVRAG
jgi:hypothetical protein